MQTFKSYLKEEQEFLTEVDTSKATNAEMAICVAYNMIHNTDKNAMGYIYSESMANGKHQNEVEQANFDLAVARAGVGGKEGKFEGLMDVGKNVANSKDANKWGVGNTGANGNPGNILVHAGASSSEKTQYISGVDNTSKADIRGAKPYQISLKKGGAQLMSAKSGEAEGIFESALKHYGKGADNPIFQEALEILRGNMDKSARDNEDALIRAGAAKDEFVDWYATASKRSKALKNLKIDWNKKIKNAKGRMVKGGWKDLDTHLRAEMKILGFPTTAGQKTAHLKLHPDIKPRLFSHKGSGRISQSDKDKLKVFEDEFANDTTWTLGSTEKRSKEDIQISDRHLIKLQKAGTITSKDLVDKNIKKQIIDVIHVTATSTEWKETLENAFKSDTEFSRWLVYEGASGYYKFVGKPNGNGGLEKNATKHSGAEMSVANRMVIFEDSGVTYDDDMITYAYNNSKLVTNLDISYKASGAHRYIKFGVPSVVKDAINNSYESELPMLQEELDRLDAQYMLNEGVFSFFASAKQKLIAFKDKIKNIVVNFWENVVKKFIEKLGEWLKEGVDIFMEKLGFKGGVTFGTV